MRGHPALVGDDAGGTLHRGYHVGHRHLGDDDVALGDLVELVEFVDDADRPGDDAWACSQSAEQDVAGALCDLRPPVRHCLARGSVDSVVADGGDGPRLEHVDVAVDDGPLDVLRRVVVGFDLFAEVDEGGDLFVGEDALFASVVGDVDLDGLAGVLVFDVHQLLVRDGYVDDLPRLAVDDVVVRGDGPGDDGLAESPRRLDDDARFAGRRVRGEHHARLLGVDHLLDHDGDVDLVVREPLLVPVVDGALGEQRGPTLLDPFEEVLLGDVEERLLLAREGGVGEVLGRRRRADGDERLLVTPDGAIGVEDLLAYLLGHRCPHDEFVRTFLRSRERLGVLGVDVHRGEQVLVDAGVLDELPIGACRHDEPRRYREAC